VLPTDIEFDAPRVVQYTEKQAKEAREDGVDLLEEAQEQALARSALYQQQLRRYHSRKICPLAFREGDLILRLVQNTKGMHKLSSPWEGPFIVSRVLGNGHTTSSTHKSPGRTRQIILTRRQNIPGMSTS
jgi:hypothetical protein